MLAGVEVQKCVRKLSFDNSLKGPFKISCTHLTADSSANANAISLMQSLEKGCSIVTSCRFVKGVPFSVDITCI